MKKVFLVVLSLIFILVAAIVILPVIFKGDIIDYIKNETIKGQVEFDEDISIGLISTFPNLNIAIRDIKVINAAPFEGDTLFQLEELKATVDLMKIIGGDIEVMSIALQKPNIKVYVREDGTANYDIALESEEAVEEEVSEGEDAAFSFKLSSLTITDGFIGYYDESLATNAVMKGFNFKMGGVFNEEVMDIESNTVIEALTVDFDGVKYLNKTKLDYLANMALYLNDEKYEFKENALQLNELALSLDGMFQFKEEDMLFDMRFGLDKAEFKDLLSLVPAVYMADYDGLEASGKFGFDGEMVGLMTETEYPAFGLSMVIENGAFKYPDLPSSLNNTQVDISISSPGGVFDNTVVEMSKCHFEVDQEPFDATLLLKHPETDPALDASFVGKVNLGNVANLIPMEGIEKLEGIIDANMQARGTMSAIDEERYEDFYAAGSMEINQFAYKDADLAEEVGIPNCEMEFAPEFLSLNNLDLVLGESDLNLTGKVSNYLPYVLRDETIQGELALTGNYFDVDPWLTEDGEEMAEETDAEVEYELEVVEVPGNIDFVFTTLLNQVKYDSYDLKKVKGEITVRNQIINFKDLGLEMLGGSIVMNGDYNTQDLSAPTSSFGFDMSSISIPGLYETFNTVKELMPIARQMEGVVDGYFDLSTVLGNDMMPLTESINGKAKLKIDRVSLEGNDTWNKAVKYLGWGKGDEKLVLTKIRPNFKIVNGNVFLDTFDFDIKGQAFKFGGKSSLDQTIDYGLDTEVPMKGMSDKAENLLAEISNQALQVDLADEVDVRFMITGPMSDPEFKPVVLGKNGQGMSLKDQAAEKVEELKEQAVEEAKTKTKAELKKQADKLRDDAQALREKAKQLKAEAAKLSKQGEDLKKESESLRKEADAQKAKIAKEMSALPKIAREKAMKPVDKIFDKADTKLDEANKYFDLAKKPEQQADKLLKQADDLEKKADDLLK